jgi:hypothetical protein
METEKGYLGNRFIQTKQVTQHNMQPLMETEADCLGNRFIQPKQVTEHSIQPL